VRLSASEVKLGYMVAAGEQIGGLGVRLRFSTSDTRPLGPMKGSYAR
jgi:hypothetical protein